MPWYSSSVSKRVFVASDSGYLGTGRNCAGSELLSRNFVGPDAKLHYGDRVGLEHDLLAAAVAEVNNDIGSLGRAKRQELQRNRRRQQALVAANLVEGESVLQREMEEP